MMLPTDDQLDQISHADLVTLVKALIARVERLEEENRQLKAEIERLKQPPANSRNSSQPPSRDQKSNPPAAKPKKKHGKSSPRFRCSVADAETSDAEP
jgi:cell division septum initiation protein DivIVA